MDAARFYTLNTVLKRLSINSQDLGELIAAGKLSKPVRPDRYPVEPVDKLYWERFYRQRPAFQRPDAE